MNIFGTRKSGIETVLPVMPSRFKPPLGQGVEGMEEILLWSSLCQQLIDKRFCFPDADQITQLPPSSSFNPQSLKQN